MKILILGSGAREHALAWKIAQSPQCEKVFLHPGNGGTRLRGFATLEIDQLTLETVYSEIQRLKVSLVVIGPELLLQQGYGDFLRERKIMVVGPGVGGARLECSKAFAKKIMVAANIPTAPSRVLKSEKDFQNHSWPVVLKYDGLAAGKGVVIAQSESEAAAFFSRVWEKNEFGAGGTVLVEEFIEGKELSYMGLCDGETFLPLASATDYKRIFDGDKGPNTGGMGAISPSPYFNSRLEGLILERITVPLLAQLKKERIDYRGVLYIGLMVDKTGNPFVLEFNARFGDPETQAVLMRLETDFVSLLLATARGELSHVKEISWSKSPSLYVVASASGYPEAPKMGHKIEGTAEPTDSTVFFAGVASKDGSLVTAGGRVLGVGALGKDFAECRKKAYHALSTLRFDGAHYRKDIGLV